MTTGSVSAQLSPSFSSRSSKQARQKELENRHKKHAQWLALAGTGAFLLGASFWKVAQLHPEEGLRRGVKAMSTPLSRLTLPKGGMSLVDLTSTGMTTINSISRVLFAVQTKQHIFETLGLESLTRVSNVSLIKAVKGENSIFSINRWFLSYLMKPKNLTRVIDVPKNTSLWSAFNSHWRNQVGLLIQGVWGLNTPFEIMFPHLKTLPAPASEEAKVVDAFRKDLTLESTEEAIHLNMLKGAEIMKQYQTHETAFEHALAHENDPQKLIQAYEQLASVQYDYNHHFFDTRYGKTKGTTTEDNWVGRYHKNLFEERLAKLGHPNLNREALQAKTKRFWLGIEAQKEAQNGIHLAYKGDPQERIDWEAALIKTGSEASKKHLQQLRHRLKAHILEKPLIEKFNTVLIQPDGSEGIPEKKVTERFANEILIPYLREAVKYYTYSEADRIKLRALKKKQEHLLAPPNLVLLQESGFAELVDGFYQDLQVLYPSPTPRNLTKNYLTNELKVQEEKKLSESEKLKQIRQLFKKRIRSYIAEIKESQNLILNEYSHQAHESYHQTIQKAVKGYLQQEKTSPQNADLGYELAQHLGEARRIQAKDSPMAKNVNSTQFEGNAFDLMDAGFKLNQRIADIDQYQKNQMMKSALQVAFQTVVTSFVLSNVLFFVIYNTFARLDPDYQGRGKIPLNDLVEQLKGLIGIESQAQNKPKKPVEAEVNLSINFQPSLKAFRPEKGTPIKHVLLPPLPKPNPTPKPTPDAKELKESNA